ncbi:MAG TPA: hypothetical protein VKS78_08740 [Roseiarcus sp.]|nr:hypothetical protein [Roseiarcus sp.]
MGSVSHRADGAGGVCRVSLMVAAALALSGCVETAAELAPDADPHTHIARRPDVSLAGATVAFVSVDGPPAVVSANFVQDLRREAVAQDIAIVDVKKAHYFVRGYLSAYLTSEGAAVEYVWDVFTKDKTRAQRMNDVIAVKGQGSDPWAVAGDAALASVAAKSAEDLAAFLSNTPEAIAEVKSPAGATAHAAADETKALSYAPAE